MRKDWTDAAGVLFEQLKKNWGKRRQTMAKKDQSPPRARREVGWHTGVALSVKVPSIIVYCWLLVVSQSLPECDEGGQKVH